MKHFNWRSEDKYFVEAVPYGSIKNPAAYAHRIALKTRRRLVEMTPPGHVSEVSRFAERIDERWFSIHVFSF